MAWGAPPLPVIAAVGVLLAAAPAGIALTPDRPAPTPAAETLGDVARGAGCRLTEFDGPVRSNPPVTGRVDERVSARDGSHVGRRSPSDLAAVHALLHGRVVVQFAPRTPAAQVAALDRLVRADADRVVLFENRTGMRHRVAATAYLSLMTCPRVDSRTLEALRTFRDRRRGFGQDF